MGNSYWWIIIVFFLLAFLFLLFGVRALLGRRFFRLSISWTLAFLFFALAALVAMMAMATQGYRAFSREERAARVRIEPLENQWFRAEFYLSDGRFFSFRLAGDELYVDAHILKWKPIANLFGLHTAYELDRVAGRYRQLIDEQTKPRTVFSLSHKKPMNIFELRKRYFFFRPLLDAEYGSATFIAAGKRVELDILVSISGLLIRTAKEK